MENKTSPHILNTSTNLLGFCLIVITSLQISNYAITGIIDEATSIVAVLLIFSCLTSFLSLQTKEEEKSREIEKRAEYLFAVALIGVLVIIILIALNFIK